MNALGAVLNKSRLHHRVCHGLVESGNYFSLARRFDYCSVHCIQWKNSFFRCSRVVRACESAFGKWRAKISQWISGG